MLMFQNPRDYWDSYNLPTVKWVSLRLRCLLGSLIKLSNLPDIDCVTMITVKDAFTVLIASDNFRRLPSNYPNTGLIKELQQKLAFIVKKYKRLDHIRYLFFPGCKHYSDEEATNILQPISQYEKIHSIKIKNL